MMARTQITLEPQTQRRAKQRASELDISLAEYIRRLVNRDLGEPEPSSDPSRIFGLGSSGGSDIAREKDAMIGAAFDSGRQGRR